MINIELPPAPVHFAQGCVANGQLGNVREVMCAGLRQLQEAEKTTGHIRDTAGDLSREAGEVYSCAARIVRCGGFIP